MAVAEVNGARIGYEEKGHGAPSFVFIHGWACDRSTWQPQVEELAQAHRCLSVDLRGRGESSKTPPYDTTQAADDVAALMLYLGFEPSIIVGHSLGGLVALLLNDRHPELVRGIVLGDSPLTAAQSGGLLAIPALIRESGSMDPVMGTVEGFFGEGTQAGLRDRLTQMIAGCDPEVAAGMLENTTVFVERMDDLLRRADQKPFMAIWSATPLGNPDELRGVTVFLRQEPIPGAAHFFQLEKPEVTIALLRAFVDDVERDPRLQTAQE